MDVEAIEKEYQEKYGEIDEFFVEHFGQPLERTELGYKVRVLREDTYCNTCEDHIRKYEVALVSKSHKVHHEKCWKKKVLAEI